MSRHLKKLLILGQHSSGKSTIFRQFRMNAGEKFTLEEKRRIKTHIHRHVLHTVHKLLIHTSETDILSWSDEAHAVFKKLSSLVGPCTALAVDDEESELTREIAELVETLWKKALPLQRTFRCMDQFGAKRLISEEEFVRLTNNQQRDMHLSKMLDDVLRGLYPSMIIPHPLVFEIIQFLPASLSGIYSSCKYFLDDIMRISEDDYVPTERDIFHHQFPSEGIIELKVDSEPVVDRGTIVLIEIGEQRSHNMFKKFHQFNDIFMLLYVTSLPSYCEYDCDVRDEQALDAPVSSMLTNAMTHDLSVFETTVNHKCFTKIDVALFLNKKDLFRQRLEEIPLTRCFPEYPGNPQDYEACSEYVKTRYESRFVVNEKSKRQLYVHFTDATDTENMSKVVWDVQNVVIRSNLLRSGLI